MRQVVRIARMDIGPVHVSVAHHTTPVGKDANSLLAQGLKRQAAFVGLVHYALPPQIRVAR